MAGMPVLVIGWDRVWRSRMQRLLAARGEMDWLGAFAPAQERPEQRRTPALLLLDGDDPTVERETRRPLLVSPRRLYFFRKPTPANLLLCISARASACLDKLAPVDTVLRGLRAAESGLFVASPALLLHAIEGMPVVAPVAAAPRGDWSALTTRQHEILHWMGRGMSNKAIARQLGISPETVKSHVQQVFERGGVHGRTALVAARRDAPLRDVAAIAAARPEAVAISPR
jgi:DNA-binding NarL/FixJ family response regulator